MPEGRLCVEPGAFPCGSCARVFHPTAQYDNVNHDLRFWLPDSLSRGAGRGASEAVRELDMRPVIKRFLRGSKVAPATLLLAILTAGFSATWMMGTRAENEMRTDLLQQTRLVAKAVEIERVRTLAGTEADLQTPHYRLLKNQLLAARSSNPKFRLIYLLGRRSDGSVFYFADSESAGSKDFSPPGRPYNGSTAEMAGVFAAHVPFFEGPVTGRRGMWTSAMVPLSDPHTGAVVALLGMDMDARAWRREMATRAAWPMGLMLMMLIGMAAFYASAGPVRHGDTMPKPVLRRLLPALAALVILRTAGTGLLLWHQHGQLQSQAIAAETSAVFSALHVLLDQQAVGLNMVTQPIAAEASVQKALRAGDADSLLATWKPMFETLRGENNLTHFSFLDANRGCLLRVDKPEKRGDLINRFTALEAERTGKPASGIEVGPLGTLTLRSVRPVFDGGTLVGYVGMGKEIEDVLQAVKTQPGEQLAVVIRKEYLNRQTWEEGMRLLGRDADWDRLPHSVVIYSSQGRLPDILAVYQKVGEAGRGETNAETAADGKAWRVYVKPLQDASGKVIGDLLVMRDISAAKAALAHLLSMGGIGSGVLLSLLLGLLYVLLSRTDKAIRVQQESLRASEEKYRLMFDNANDAIFIHDTEARVLEINPQACERLGYTRAQLLGMTIGGAVSPENALREREHIARLMEQGRLTFETAHRRKDGSTVPTEVSARRIAWEGQPAVMSICRDITERKRTEMVLRESEQNFRNLMESGQALVWVSGTDKLCTYFNRVWLEFTGRTLEQEKGMGWAEGVHPQDVKRCLALFVGACERREPFSMEYRLRRHDGEYRWILDDGCPRYDSKGEFIGYIGHCLDITGRMQAEEQIRRNETRLRRLVDILQCRAKTMPEFLKHALTEAIQLTESTIGYIFSYDQDRELFFQHTWFTGQTEESTGGNPPPSCALITAGLWGEVVRQRRPVVLNDFQSEHAYRNGFPKGHVHLDKFMSVPVFKEDRIVAVVGVANKASDYDETDVLQLTLLMDAVWKAVDIQKTEEALRETRAILQAALAQSQAGIAIADAPGGELRYMNDAGLLMLGGDRQSVVDGVGFNRFVASWQRLDLDGRPLTADEAPLARALTFGEACCREFIMRKGGDEERIVFSNAAPIKDHTGKVVAGIEVFMDITASRQAEEEIQQAYVRESAMNDIMRLTLVDLPLDRLIGRALDSVLAVPEFALETQGAIFLVEDAPDVLVLKAQRNFTAQKQEACARVPFKKCQCGHAADSGAVQFCNGADEIHDALFQGIMALGRYSAPMRLGSRTIGVLTVCVGPGHARSARLEQLLAGVANVLAGVIARKQLEETRTKLQNQLTQAQKMESVGRLAGGVAHDFNNMLGVIIGTAEMALGQVGAGEPLHEDLTEIHKAAERSADLTRQLLAFARKQAIVPKVLNLNETVEDMFKILQRLVGEDVDVIWQPDREIWPVKLDPSQLDQILANLCVNARDAISGVGKLTIATHNQIFDDDACAVHAECAPGEYVLLAVSDDGCGMDKETAEHLFEPFFTTKEAGAGTGLGLATVYGIVKQNNGFISLISAPGQGSTFKLYLPRYRHEAGGLSRMEDADERVVRGHETVLLVEDEPALLKLSKRMLERRGYTVLAADSHGEALHLANAHAGQFRLLITDVVMPGMNGRELADKLLTFNPNLKCLFMSGYTANVIANHGMVKEGINFIQKPFTVAGLTAKVRELLDFVGE